MKRAGYITIGVFVFLLITISIVVFRVSGSEDSVFVKGCTPYNVSIKRGEGENSVDISWETKDRCSGYILYGVEMRELNLVGVDLENDVRGKRHDIVIRDLLTTRRYYFSIISEEVTYGKDGLPLQFSIDSL